MRAASLLSCFGSFFPPQLPSVPYLEVSAVGSEPFLCILASSVSPFLTSQAQSVSSLASLPASVTLLSEDSVNSLWAWIVSHGPLSNGPGVSALVPSL